ncbi:hypothetical protein [Pandoraea aquatica]|nr:hypothetical protein [Pandoraea aquatica]
MQEFVQVGRGEQTRLYDDQLDALRAKLNGAKRDSPQACDAFLLLQRQFAHLAQQKIDFVAKLVTEETFAARQ